MMMYDVTPQLPRNGFTAAELFCGGGLMGIGLKTSGFNIVWANDFDKNAVKAYRHNLGDYVVHADITAINPADIPDVDVIAGGPPCQDYSVAGKGEGEKGERGKLIFAYLDIIRAKMPKSFIFENVKGLVGKKHRHTFEKLLEEFNRIGYTVSWKVINAWDYGVAQKRERVFIVGVRNDLGFSFVFPEPEPEDYRTKVLRDVIGDLPDPGVKLTDKQIAFLERNPVSVAKNRPVTMDEPSQTIPAVMHKGVPYGLFYPNHDRLPVSAFKEYKFDASNRGAGWNEPSVTIRANTVSGQPWHPSKYEVLNHDKKSYWYPKNNYSYAQANRVQSMDKPSNTIPAHHNSGQPIHPTQAPRRFTVRECLRIQSAPDWYVLPDDISLSAQYRIVGNGVPCRVAWYLGRALADQLKEVMQ